MNHTNSTLVIVAIAASMVVAATTLALGSISEHLAYAKGTAIKAGGGVKVGGTSNKCKQDADNSQHIAFGAGSTANAAANAPVNVQTQDCNAGSTGSGGSSNNRESSDGTGVWNSGLSTSDS